MANYTVPSLPPSPSGDGDFNYEEVWYGNIQYLLNISAIGAITCLLIFILIKLRSDHRRMPGPTAIVSKLLAAWHATGREIARHCGADAAQFLLIEGGSCGLLLSLAILAISVMLPVNIYADLVKVRDDIAKLVARIESRGFLDEAEDNDNSEDLMGCWGKVCALWRTVVDLWYRSVDALGFLNEERLRKLHELRADLEMEMAAYKDG